MGKKEKDGAGKNRTQDFLAIGWKRETRQRQDKKTKLAKQGQASHAEL